MQLGATAHQDVEGIRQVPVMVQLAPGRDLDRLFWSLMLEPTPLRTSGDWVDRLVGRLVLLHECYEQAMDQLGLARATSDSGLVRS